MWGRGIDGDISEPSAQLCCVSKTALKIKFIDKKQAKTPPIVLYAISMQFIYSFYFLFSYSYDLDNFIMFFVMKLYNKSMIILL